MNAYEKIANLVLHITHEEQAMISCLDDRLAIRVPGIATDEDVCSHLDNIDKWARYNYFKSEYIEEIIPAYSLSSLLAYILPYVHWRIEESRDSDGTCWTYIFLPLDKDKEIESAFDVSFLHQVSTIYEKCKEHNVNTAGMNIIEEYAKYTSLLGIPDGTVCTPSNYEEYKPRIFRRK